MQSLLVSNQRSAQHNNAVGQDEPQRVARLHSHQRQQRKALTNAVAVAVLGTAICLTLVTVLH